ncbi:MAG: cellulose biosynthesis cyclic di-GMP-binding regulatory protein BcsB, partial [Rhodobacteraceae bacterium]|nr:cellulose biosynthesis cyclic di-GMP-binding regulatory protein BcsB [Paracoccaceae bacterium]
RPLPLRGPAPLPAWAAEALPQHLEAMTRALGAPLPGVALADYWVVARQPPEPVRVTYLDQDADGDAALFRRGGDGAVVLVLTPDTPPQVLADALMLAAAPGGLGVGDTRPARLAPGAPLPISALRFPEGLSGAEHVFLRHIDFRLPDDWLLLAQQKARLDLDYGFAEGLARGALLMVKINDTTIRLLPLDRGDGSALDTLPVSFEARLLRPGINRLTFEAEIPADPADLPCPVRDAPMLTIAPSSALFVPESPRMRQPDLSHLLARTGPEALRATPAARAQMPTGAPESLRAALALGAPDGGSRTELLLAVPADLANLRDTPLAAARPGLEALLLGTARRTAAVATTAPGAEAGDEVTFGWRSVLGIDRVAALPAEGRAMLERVLSGVVADPGTWLEGRSGMAVLLQPDPFEQPDLAWLVLRSDADTARVGAALALARDTPEGPRGQIAILGTDGRWTSWVSPDRPLHLLEPVTAGNLRNVLGNYATWSPLAFVLAFLGVTLLTALVALAIALVTRRPSA